MQHNIFFAIKQENKAELVPGSSGLPADTSERIMNIVSFNRTPSLEPFVWGKYHEKKLLSVQLIMQK